MYECFPSMYVCVPRVWFGHAEINRECHIHWDWRYKRLWAALWMLENEPRSSTRARSAVTCQIIFQPPYFNTWMIMIYLFLLECVLVCEGHITTFGKWFFLFTTWVRRLQLRFSGLKEGTFIHWVPKVIISSVRFLPLYFQFS